MKKLAVCILVSALILSLASCGISIVQKPVETAAATAAPGKTPSPTETAAPVETDVPTETAAPAETDAPESPENGEPEDGGPDYANYALTGVHVLERGFTNGRITDEASAVAVISRCSEAIGCTNALEELTPCISCSLDGETYYRLQQCCRGLPVYGRYVVAVASAEGEVLGLTTDARDIPEDLDLTPTVTEDEVRAGVTEHAMYTRGVLRDDMEIQPLSEGKLVIYDLDEALGARLAYELLVENEGQYTVIVDAKTGEVLEAVERMHAASEQEMGTLAGDETKKVPVTKKTDDEGDAYTVEDTERGLKITDLNREEFTKTKTATTVASRGDKIFGNTEDEKKRKPEIAFNLMISISEIRDYWNNHYGLGTPFKTILLFYNDGYCSGNNAVGGDSFDKNGTHYGMVRIGYGMDGSEKQILAHEYTHVLQAYHQAAIGGGKEAIAIREGLADTFSMFYAKNWDFDISSIGGDHRNAINPGAYGYPSSVDDPQAQSFGRRFLAYFDGDSYGHTYATVISHAAYLMYESGAFRDLLELQHIWFRTLLRLPFNCTFLNLRCVMEHTAVLYGCTDAQEKAISGAFDAVGISYDKTQLFKNDIKITVYDQAGQSYDDYTVEIYSENIFGIGGISNKPSRIETAKDAEPMEIHLDNGKYEIKIIDNANRNNSITVPIEVILYDISHPTAGYIYGENIYVNDFGADYTVSPGAKLTVLDVNGEVLTDYHASVRMDDGFREFTDGVVDLPEKNYYEVLLNHREGGTVYWDGFTLRVKEGAKGALTYQSRFAKAPAPEAPPEEEDTDTALAEVEAGIQGLWNTRNWLGLLSFEDGKVTYYHLCHPGDDPADRVYVKGETAEYTIEPLSEESGKGYRITWGDQAEEYRLLDGSPDEMIWFRIDSQGEFLRAEYNDLIRFTDYGVEDIIPVVNAAAAPISEECAYTGTVRSYIAEYGELEFKSDGSGSYYLGVFLVKLIDFDRDGTEELVVGYATENAEGYCPQPKLDVWTLEGGEPVLVYEHARIGHGDIGSHCAYIEWDGRTCLVTGYSGFETALTLRAFENGHFEEILTVEMEYGDGEYRWTVNGEAVSEEEGAEISHRINEGCEEYNGYIGSPSHGAKPQALILAELEYGYKVLGLRDEIMAWYGF